MITFRRVDEHSLKAVSEDDAPKGSFKRTVQFLLRTVLGGLLFLIPIVLLVIILRQAFSLLARMLRPVARLAPSETVLGIVVVDVLAVLAIIGLCVALGLLLTTTLGRRAAAVLERGILRKMPGYSLLKSATHSVTGAESSEDVHAALARIEDAWVPAFVIEQHSSGLITVFVPSSPTPTSGSIYYLTRDRVKFVHVPVSKMVSCLMRLGVGSNEILDTADLSEESEAKRLSDAESVVESPDPQEHLRHARVEEHQEHQHEA